MKTESKDVYRISYEGGLKEGLPCGNGTFSYEMNGQTKRIKGIWKWVKDEKQKDRPRTTVYTGMKCNEKICGWGKMVIDYEGTFKGIFDHERVKIGSFQWMTGECYEGMWQYKDGMNYPHGNGCYVDRDGECLEGRWVYGIRIRG